ncbi:MAG: DUF927 domain-containing protein [Acidobacteriaceae bacterium]
MDTTEFFRRILPATGLYVVARLLGKGFRHQVCETVEEASAYALAFDAQGVPTYHACAAFREASVETKHGEEVWHQVRTHANVRALRSFYMDLDVKPGNPRAFESQDAACEALASFCTIIGVPLPMVVSSGGGIHIYWTLDHEILPQVWKQTAEDLKQLAAYHKFNADPAVTADQARVLRPVGTWNRKASIGRPVELVIDSMPVLFLTFRAAVIAALKSAGIKQIEAVRQVEGQTEGINQAFAVQRDFAPCSGVKVATKCAQLAKIRDTRGCVPEPHWYAAIQLLCHATEGDALIHQWSNGYEGYSEAETNQKIAQVRSQGLGPTLCTTFESRAPGGCDGCPFRGKISSPLQLGTRIESLPAPVVQNVTNGEAVDVTLPDAPSPFTRGADGIYVEEDGITHKIYENDCFPIELAWDEQLGYETMRWRHHSKQEGWKECVLRSSLLARPLEFEAALRDNHIQPLIRNKMAMYADAYIRKLRDEVKLRQLFKSQGWKNDESEFVLGDRLYRKDGFTQAGFSHGAESFLAPFKTRGTLATWRALTSVLDTPGLDAHAFMLLLAFASPLLKLAGRDGFTVNALGDTGIGKSTMARFMCSVYGHPTAAWISREDTALARVQRFGAHSVLPVYMDEATTIDPKELRDVIYMVPTGKSRASMTRDYKLRAGAEWSTIFVTSTNDSLQTKLQIEKENPEAESMRLFEFWFPRVPDFGPVSKMIPSVVLENHGVAGAQYVQNLVAHRDQIRETLLDPETGPVACAERDFGMQDKERFWSQAIATALYGGRLAHTWGIIDFDPDRIRPWLLAETRRMRGDVEQAYVNPITVLANYLNAHVGERLVITELNSGMTTSNYKPGRILSQRYEPAKGVLWAAVNSVKSYIDTHFFNFNEIRTFLASRGILMHTSERKVLGSGTDYTGAATTCWKINTKHPELAGRIS